MIQQQHESFQKLSNSGEDGDSVRHSKQSGQLVRPPSHSSTIPHSEIVKEPAYRGNFALSERLSLWFLNCFRCNNNDASFVNTLEEVERRNPTSISEDLKKIVEDNKIMKLKIGETSRLQLDANVMHPFVKVHVVNKNTGCYIRNSEKTDDPIVYHKEELTSYNRIERKYESTENDIILPFATACCDFRKLGNSKGVWNQKFYINYPCHLLLSPDTVILFEILDFNHQALLYRNDEEQYDRNNMFRVAWAFLRPVGVSKTHLGKVHLELYSYKYSPPENEPTLNKSFIPDVYYDFIWNSHEKYEGYLQVQLNYCSRPRYKYIGDDLPCPTNLFEEEQENRTYLQRYRDELEEKQEDKAKATKDLFKFFRNRSICEVPKQLIYKLESESLGCFRLKFIGNFLLAACSRKKMTIIKVFDLGNGEHVMSLRGHRGIIYHMETTQSERLLVTSGSDHLVRVSAVPEYTGEFIDEDESEEFVVADLVHSAAVYSVSLVHQPLQETLFILTCCYDGYVRLWECKVAEKRAAITMEVFMNDKTRSAEKRVYPTASAVCEGNFFIIGDSIGEIRIYDFRKDRLEERCIIRSGEMRNDMVLNIHILNKNHLMIQASDNLIRHFDLIGNKIRLSQSYSGGVFEKDIVQCALSPDNKYVMSPSELGKPVLWDVFTGNQISLDHLNLSVRKHLVCCDWHPRYNLVAISGFYDSCPVFVYGNVLGEAEIKLVSAQMA